MADCIRLTRGALTSLKKRYASILRKCFFSALCTAFMCTPALASIPPAGSSFNINENMLFQDQGNLVYGTISGGYGFTLTLENTNIDAANAEIEDTKLNLSNSSFGSRDVMRIHETYMADSQLFSKKNMVFSAPLNVLSGVNTLTSTEGDLYLGYGINKPDSATLDIYAQGDIGSVSGMNIRANSIAADHVISYGNVTLENGTLRNTNKYNPSVIFDAVLTNMHSEINHIVSNTVAVTGGTFTAAAADFMTSASFSDAEIHLGQLTASTMEVNGGSLEIAPGKGSHISKTLTLDNTDTTIGDLKVDGETNVHGGVFKAATLELAKTAFSSTQAEIDNLTLKGPLSLVDHASLTAPGSALAEQELTIQNSTLNARGDFAPASLRIDGSAINVSGVLQLATPDFQLKDSNISAADAAMNDFVSTGESSLKAGANISARNVTVNGGTLVMVADLDNGVIRGSNLLLQNSADTHLQASQTIFDKIHGSGSLSAHNLNLAQNLELSQSAITLSGQAAVGGNVYLDGVRAGVNDLHVKGAVDLKASSVSGRNLTLEQGAVLDDTSVLEARSLTSGGDIVLANNAELLAGEVNMGGAHMVLEGAQGQRAVAAVGDFGSGDLTVETNSMLSIGNVMPDWVNMGMDGHRASAALGLWEPLQLGAGAQASVGAGSLARARTGGGNLINFTSDSLLITNAKTASANGSGAISAQAKTGAYIASGAKLHILHVQKDGLYRVLGENITVNYEGDAWQGSNVRTDTRLIQLERLEGDKLGWFQAKAAGPGAVLPDVTPPIGPGIGDAGNGGLLPPETDIIPSKPITPSNPGAPDKPDVPDTPDRPSVPETPPSIPDTPVKPDKPGVPDTPPVQPDTPVVPDKPETPPQQPDVPDAPDAPRQPEGPYEPEVPEDRPVHVYTPGQKFLSRALNFWFIGYDGHLASKTIESACRILALGAVPELTIAANQAGVSAMQARTGAMSQSSPHAMNSEGEIIKEEGFAARGFALWVTPLYKSVNGYSLSSGYWETDINGGLGGLALGGDYTFANNLRVGLSFNIGGGYSHGDGGLADTTNNMSFWGVGAYFGWNWNDLDVSGDAAYTSTYNKLKQELHPGMQMDDLKSDITAWALSAGVDIGWTMRTDYMDIRPHAGARYTYLRNNSYDVNSGGTVLEGKAKNAEFWTFPVGVSFQKKFELSNGWQFQPALDLAVIPAAGENKLRTEVRYTGTPTWMDLKDQFMDDITYRGALGLQFSTDNVTLGISCSMQAGMKTNSQTVMGNFMYSF